MNRSAKWCLTLWKKYTKLTIEEIQLRRRVNIDQKVESAEKLRKRQRVKEREDGKKTKKMSNYLLIFDNKI